MSNYNALNAVIEKLAAACDEAIRECNTLAADGVSEAAEMAEEISTWKEEFLVAFEIA